MPYPPMASAGEGRSGAWSWRRRPVPTVSALVEAMARTSGSFVGKARTALPCIPCIVVVKEGMFVRYQCTHLGLLDNNSGAAEKREAVSMKTAALLQWPLSRITQRYYSPQLFALTTASLKAIVTSLGGPRSTRCLVKRASL